MIQIGNNVPNEYVFVVDSPQVPNGRMDLGATYVQKKKKFQRLCY